MSGAPGQSRSMSGEILSHYRLLEKVGEGGMGTVYKAEDIRLGRTVAVKVLSQQFSADRLSVERFQREASSASALNHPHICTIHDFGEEMGQWYLVMEYLQGQDLKVRIAGGPLGLRETLRIALQALEALAAAHQSNIIHRDIKPANIFLTEGGTVKLLDFGLAKRAPQAPEAGWSTANTLTMPGLGVGTANYMSPEQACGMEVDARSDLFSFGVVLYEMATGAEPFQGKSLPAVLSAIVHLPPRPAQQFNPAIPAELQRIIEKALEKDPELRYQSAIEMRADLRRLDRQVTAVLAAGRISGTAPVQLDESSQAAFVPWRGRVPWLAAAVVAVAGGVLGWMGARAISLREARPSYEYKHVTDLPGMEQFPSLDATGEWLVYAARPRANWDLYLQRVDGHIERNLTESTYEDDTHPAFSPDGKQIVFRSSRDGGGLFVMGATGEAPERISTTGFNPCWSPDGRKIAFATEGVDSAEDRYLATSQLWVVDLDTRQKRMVFDGDAVQPAWSPGGHRIAFWRSRGGRRDVATIPAGGGAPVAVTSDAHTDWNPVWSPDGRHLYFVSDRSGNMNLWRVAIDEETGAVKGKPEAVTLPSSHVGHISFSRDGRKVLFASSAFRSTLNRVAFDAQSATVTGTAEEITLPFSQVARPHLSADGGWLAFNSKGLIEDIHVARADGSNLRHITNDGRGNRGARWAPDGTRVAFFSVRGGNNEIWMANSDGTSPRQVTFSKKNAVWPVWSPDGKRMAFTLFGEGGSIIDADRAWSEQTPQPLPAPGPGESFNAWSWSNDGKSIAGFLQNTNEGTFPGIAVYSVESGTYRRVSEFGMDPVWLAGGRRLLFNHAGRIYLADTNGGAVREVMRIAPSEVSRRGFSVSADSRWIYFALSSNESDIWMAQSK